MEIVLNNKTYVMPKVKTRMLRKAIEINENIDFSNLKTKDLDGLNADKLIETLNNSINGIVGTMGNKLKEFPNK